MIASLYQSGSLFNGKPASSWAKQYLSGRTECRKPVYTKRRASKLWWAQWESESFCRQHGRGIALSSAEWQERALCRGTKSDPNPPTAALRLLALELPRKSFASRHLSHSLGCDE